MPQRRKSSSSKPRKSRRSHTGGSSSSEASSAALPAAQTGGQGVPEITQETLEAAGKMAQQLMNNAMSSSQNNSSSSSSSSSSSGSAPQTGGSALQGSEINGVDTSGLKAAMTAGAVGGAVAAAEGYSSLNGSPLTGGRRRRGRGRRGGSSSSSSQRNETQNGGMIPGLMTAVETALVPLGLYLGQKALQSRRSGNRSLGKSFNPRRSRSTRRRNRK